MPTVLHLIYIHGFQGNDTSFQSFPTHLQEQLAAAIPEHLNLKVQSSLYPTYKCIKPISNATKNFLEWLSTQPPGPVILLAHSMGGLLAADAATDPSNNPDQYPGAKPKRIVGVVAFDTPYLGMHPHVVISGIASLLPKGNETGKEGQSDREMNDQKQVKIVDEKVTDDWEEYKKNLQSSDSSLKLSPPQSIHVSTNMSSRASSPGLIPGSNSSSPFAYRALSYVSKYSDAPIVRWVRTHADDPFSAGKRWVVEHFQFGVSMFDPRGLKSRYAHLVEWQGGLWVNYWTQTIPRPDQKQLASAGNSQVQASKGIVLDNDKALLMSGIISSGVDDSGPPVHRLARDYLHQSCPWSQPVETLILQMDITKKELTLKEQIKQGKTHGLKSGKHFIVLPKGLGQVLGGTDKWEQVTIEGVEDEVSAHTGLFIPHQNFDYEGLVERVKARILDWCENLTVKKDIESKV